MTQALVTSDKVEEDCRKCLDEVDTEDPAVGVEAPVHELVQLVSKDTERSLP